MLSVELPGSEYEPAEVEKWTVSLKPVTVFPNWSRAVTVKLKGLPEVTLEGAEIPK